MTPRDITIKRLTQDFGPLTVDHLVTLSRKEDLGSPHTLWRRLRENKPLLKDGHLCVRKRSASEKYVYATYDIRRRKGFDHDLMVSTILTTLHAEFDLRDFKRPREKFSGKLNEDLHCVLGVSLPGRNGELHYFIEADTGSEGYAQIDDKIRRYLRHHEKDREGFIMLLVTGEERRARELCRRSERLVPRGKRRMFFFTTLDQLTATPQGSICQVPFEETPHAIVPKINQEPPVPA
jgi:hypothetical protein